MLLGALKYSSTLRVENAPPSPKSRPATAFEENKIGRWPRKEVERFLLRQQHPCACLGVEGVRTESRSHHDREAGTRRQTDHL